MNTPPATQWAAGVVTLVGVVVFAWASRRGARTASSTGLLCALLGGFYLYMALSPLATTRVHLAVALFVGSAVLFRLLSSFEQ